MEWLITAGGLAVAVFAVMLTGRIWNRIHEHQARHMHEYGDRERNKYGLWK